MKKQHNKEDVQFIKANLYTLNNWIEQLEDNLKDIKRMVISMEKLLNK